MEKKHEETIKLQVEQFDNGFTIKVIGDEGKVTTAEVVQAISDPKKPNKAREWRERIGTYIADDLEAMLNLACANVAEITYTITTTEDVK